MSNTTSKKVFVAMSGGVDSSVAAALIKERGYNVVGVFMQGWNNPHFDCQWAEDRKDAARAAARIGIPFLVLDFSKEYKDKVVSYLIEGYKKGLTPNPDISCNKEIKFGIFLKWAIMNGANYIATGHYVIKRGDLLLKSKDNNKDQSYFLWALTQEQISKSLFPVGIYTKPYVRRLARKYNLPNAGKKDSQGICFVGTPGGGGISAFLKDHIETRKGVITTTAGEKIGEHNGVELFTIGQRHGIGSPGGGTAYYVSEKNMRTGTLVVAENNDPLLYRDKINFSDANWIAPVSFPFECEARIRYRGALEPCRVEDGRAVFSKPQRAVAPGQSIVFYRGDCMLGGAVIR